MPKTLEHLLGDTLLARVGHFQETANFRNFIAKEKTFHHGPTLHTGKYLATKEFVLLYFGCAWLDHCQKFLPLLQDFYNHATKLDPNLLEVVYVSSDRDKEEFHETYGTMPWLAIDDQHHKTLVTKKCHVHDIPALVVLTVKGGRFVTDQGCEHVLQTHGFPEKIEAVLESWKGMHPVSLEEAEFTSGGASCCIS